jgi:hypothetical protein
MTVAIIVVVSLAASAAAFAYPYIPFSKPSSGISSSSRSVWVNRLFALTADADAAGEQAVAVAARALIDALVNPARKGR